MFAALLWASQLFVALSSCVNTSIVQVSALEALYFGTGGNYWSWKNETDFGIIWNFSGNSDPCCDSWQGISCSNTSNIISIVLPSYNLSGSLPSELSALEQLNSINFSDNALSLQVPDSYCKFALLRSLDLSSNLLSGTLDGIYSLVNLDVVILSNNKFHGEVLQPIASNFSMLKVVRLDNNLFSGSLPSLWNACSMELLQIGNNRFTGSLPSSLSCLSNLSILSFDSNNFTGSVPQFLGSMTRLEQLMGFSNKLNGTLPDIFQNLTQLTYLDFSRNYHLNGTLPASLSYAMAASLRNLSLYENAFSGTIPASYVTLCDKLTYIYLQNNRLEGSIPNDIGRCAQLQELYLSANNLTGTVPSSMGNLTALVQFEVYANYLEGCLPAALWTLPSIDYVGIEFNLFTGLLPEGAQLVASSASPPALLLIAHSNSIAGTVPLQWNDIMNFWTLDLSYNMLTCGVQLSNLVGLLGLFLDFNHLTGAASFLAQLPSNLEEFDIGGNHFTGPLPTSLFGEDVSINTLIMAENLLSGTIPRALSKLKDLGYVDFSNNRFTGTLPELRAQGLTQLYLDNNQFTGALANVLPPGSPWQNSITSLDVSNNQFTGTLPESLFQSTSIQAFAAVSNCITGSISAAICNMSSIQQLALDGLHTASQCRYPILNSYVLSRTIEGSLPDCLFNMPLLTTLHASGNGLAYSFPANLSIASNLTDLSLSNNQLRGTIPSYIQDRTWASIDLAFNKLTGTLSAATSEASGDVSFNVNRLSGTVPMAMRDMASIDILDGNTFTCGVRQSQLPENDPARKNYSCGSNSVNQSLIAWFAFGAVVVAVSFVLMVAGTSELRKSVNELVAATARWRRVIREIDGKFAYLADFQRAMRQLGMLAVGLTVVVWVVYLPLYAILKVFYKTVHVQYAWYVSIAFQEGLVPVVVLEAVLILSFACFLYRWLQALLPQSEVRSRGARSLNPKGFFVVQRLAFVANCVLMLAINVGYVAVTVVYGETAIVLTTVAVSLVKLAWNELLIPFVLQWLHATFFHSEVRYASIDQNILLQTRLLLINNIICPAIATSLVSPECFYNLIVPPPDVQTSLAPVARCNYNNGTSFCSTANQFSASYSPPYYYNYACSFSLLTKYASIFVFMFTFEAFGKPLLLLFLTWCYNHPFVRASKRLHAVVDIALPSLLKLEASALEVVFHKDRFIIAMVNQFAVLLTFGIAFPPVALVVCVAVVSNLWLNQIMIGRYVEFGRAPERAALMLVQQVNDEAKGVAAAIRHEALLLLAIDAVVFAAFLFDISGTWRTGAVVSSLMLSLPLLWYAVRCIALVKSKAAAPPTAISVTEMASIDNPIKS